MGDYIEVASQQRSHVFSPLDIHSTHFMAINKSVISP
ncbi:hypothetical protein PL2TA16_03846 [Pseudoalteromonas luteoviolacea 2ta16]|uniref:Uncharacterized protein n=1 Tax=Pseudoalteromonas luteoviolacea (strain 2ta16) TaxID=1353533 RepID=V4HS80_PSEL2|nr:hypothetical protein PL2TA16_03846 [Pseudoalteromonas luteoviolacea 2ta16]